jgi:NADPH:quinone reductase-like Zn-dependent oxidoreductase
MQVIMVSQFGGPEVLQVGEKAMPQPRSGEVLVRVLAAGVGPWDASLRRGGWAGALPYVPGGEFAGLVVGDTGADADLYDGAPVYGYPGLTGCYAQYVTCPLEQLAPIPAALSAADAAAVPIDALTAEHHEFVHRLGATTVIDHTRPDWPEQVRHVTDGGAERVLACAAPTLDGAARAARDGALIATPVHGETPDAQRIRWQQYDGQPRGSRLIRMAPWLDDGSLSVTTAARYYWHDAAQAHRVAEVGHTAGKLVLIVDEDLADTMEI